MISTVIIYVNVSSEILNIAFLKHALGYCWGTNNSNSDDGFNLLAGVFQAVIRTDDNISTALDWLFARESCHCDRNLW